VNTRAKLAGGRACPGGNRGTLPRNDVLPLPLKYRDEPAFGVPLHVVGTDDDVAVDLDGVELFVRPVTA
jgi:hypothetical protein